MWRSTGTGTQLVADINPAGGSFPQELTDVNGTLFFTANDGSHGYELWTSDGSAAGTIRVADINQGPDGSNPEELTDVGGTLFFSATDGSGVELWKADQAATATALVSSANPAAAGQAVTFTATVSTQPGKGTPTGSVTFSIDGSPRPSLAARARNAAITTTLAPGAHQITHASAATRARRQSRRLS